MQLRIDYLQLLKLSDLQKSAVLKMPAEEESWNQNEKAGKIIPSSVEEILNIKVVRGKCPI